MNDQHTTETAELLDRLRDHWIQNGLTIRPGVSAGEIQSFESRYRLRLPTDLRSYFAAIDGMDDGSCDNEMFSFLPLESVRTVPEEFADYGGIPSYREIVRSLPEADRWFVIVDYFIASAVYGIRLSDTDEPAPVMRIRSGVDHEVVAPSFSRFLDAYLENPIGVI